MRGSQTHAPAAGPIPTAQTIREAYRFVFTHLAAIFGLAWFPALLLGLFNIGVAQNLGLLRGHGFFVTRIGTFLVFAIGDALFYAIAAVALTRQALAPQTPPVRFQFALGRTEGRLFSRLLGCLAATTAAALAIMAGGVYLIVKAPALYPGGLAFALPLLALFVFAAVRGFFFLALDSVLAPGSGASAAGNFWRVLAILLAVALPFIVLPAVNAMRQILSAWFAGAIHWPPSLDDLWGITERMRNTPDASWASLVYFIADFVSRVLVWALSTSAAVFAWRSVSSPVNYLSPRGARVE